MKRTALILVALISLGSCTPKSPEANEGPDAEPSSEAPEPEPSVPEPQAPNRPPVSSQPAPAVPAPTVRPAPVIRPFDESILRGREFLLETVSARNPEVRDPDLGPLSREAELETAVKAFFLDARDGALAPEALNPRWTPYLQGWARTFQAQAWGEVLVRVGTAITTQQGELLVPLRLTNATRAAMGWVALVREGKKILVSDIQLSEAALRTAPFDPETSGQEISSPSRR